MEWGTKLLALFDKSFTLLTAGIIAISVLLFGPDSFISKLSLTGWVNGSRTVLGLLWLGGISLFIVHLGKPLFQSIMSHWKKARITGKKKESLDHLSSEENVLLRDYFEFDVKTRTHSLEDGVVMGLVKRGVLFRPSLFCEEEDRGFTTAFNVEEWVWLHIKRHPKLIDWNGRPLSETEKRKKLKKEEERNRNSWMA